MTETAAAAAPSLRQCHHDLEHYPNPRHTSARPILQRGSSDQRPEILDIRHNGAPLDLSTAVMEGLEAQPGRRSLPSLLLWNEGGLRMFEDITYTEDYYLTNTEIEVMEAHAQELAGHIEPGTLLLELGSGNLRKVNILLKALDAQQKNVDYYALDLDRKELERTLRQVRPGYFKHVHCRGLLGTYDDGHVWLSKAENASRPRCILSLGSTIGSMDRLECAEFCKQWAAALSPPRSGDSAPAKVIIGIDGCKEGNRVWRAYNDRDGCNTHFILNALRHANEQLGKRVFTLDEWTTQGVWDEKQGRHSQYLVPIKDVSVGAVRLPKGEKVFLVSSYKYDDAEKAWLFKEAGLQEIARYTNTDRTYGLHVLQPDALSG